MNYSRSPFKFQRRSNLMVITGVISPFLDRSLPCKHFSIPTLHDFCDLVRTGTYQTIIDTFFTYFFQSVALFCLSQCSPYASATPGGSRRGRPLGLNEVNPSNVLDADEAFESQPRQGFPVGTQDPLDLQNLVDAINAINKKDKAAPKKKKVAAPPSETWFSTDVVVKPSLYFGGDNGFTPVDTNSLVRQAGQGDAAAAGPGMEFIFGFDDDAREEDAKEGM